MAGDVDVDERSARQHLRVAVREPAQVLVALGNPGGGLAGVAEQEGHRAGLLAQPPEAREQAAGGAHGVARAHAVAPELREEREGRRGLGLALPSGDAERPRGGLGERGGVAPAGGEPGGDDRDNLRARRRPLGEAPPEGLHAVARNPGVGPALAVEVGEGAVVGGVHARHDVEQVDRARVGVGGAAAHAVRHPGGLPSYIARRSTRRSGSASSRPIHWCCRACVSSCASTHSRKGRTSAREVPVCSKSVRMVSETT